MKRYKLSRKAGLGSINLKEQSLEHYTDEQLAACAAQSSEAMYILIVRYTKWIRWKASQLSGAVDADDLAQEGFLGLVSAAVSFNANRGAGFSTYAAVCITNRMRSAIRKSRSVPTPVGESSDPVFEMADTAAQPDSIVFQREETAQLWQEMIQNLSALEYQVCMMSISGMSYMEIARELKILPKTADNALQRAKRKLRRMT